MSIKSDSSVQFICNIEGKEFRVAGFSASEYISKPYNLILSLASEEEVSFKDVVGKETSLTLFSNDENRWFHGVVDEFIKTGTKGRFYLYRAEVVPNLKLLSLKQNCRIFQNKTVQEIVSQVLTEANILTDSFEFRIMRKCAPREYCVQYRETDFDFISRILSEEGIFYFFEHFKDKHLLIFGDGVTCYKPIKGKSQVLFNSGRGMPASEEFISSFSLSGKVCSGKVSLKDFNFEKPSLDLTVRMESQSNADLEIYDYPGSYSLPDLGRFIAKTRLERSEMFKESGIGLGTCCRFAACLTFKMTGHEQNSINKEYVLLQVEHAGSQPQVYEELAGTKGSSYSNKFWVIPSSVIIRPIIVPKPVIQGVQTAIVTGPAGEEIYTDLHGRIKVQFHWDRQGQKDQASSCWIRVGQIWAGALWGAVYIPRIGQEVIVDFIEGDPDRPIITGSVYNARNIPPYQLPDEKTKSGVMSRSVPGGEGFNEIRFEDKKEAEEIYIHAQKDQTEVVENNMTTTVKAGRKLTVHGSRNESIGGEQIKTIKKDSKTEITEGNFEHKVTVGTARYEVGGDLTEIYHGKQETTTSNEIVMKSDNAHIHFTGASNIKLEAGGSKITMDSNGNISLNGSVIDISSSEKIKLHVSGNSIEISPDSVKIQGIELSSESSGDNIIKGSLVKINT